MGLRFCSWLRNATSVAAVLLLLTSAARSEVIANSIDDWSADGEQGANGWTYGYFNATLDGDTEDANFGYGTDLFIDFGEGDDEYEWNGTQWDYALGNVPWTAIGQENGHPNGDNNGDVHFAIRRWESDYEGTAYLTSSITAGNLNGGGGTTVHVFHNGSLLDTVMTGGTDPVAKTNWVEATLAPGDIIDFALSPQNLDLSFGDGADGTLWSLDINDVRPPDPEPEPERIASSRNDWSEDGEQGVNGWTYGYFNVSLDGDFEDEEGYGYGTDLFIDFADDDDFDWTGNNWDSNLGNVPWTTINQNGGHPNGDNNGDIHFAIRRWESDTDGEVEITSSLAKQNINCGNGTSVHVYKNGELIDTITVPFDQAEATESTITATLANGDLIDFALSPLGDDGTFADGCDGSAWHLDIEAVDGGGVAGDFNENGARDVEDLDLLANAMAANDLAFDLNGDGTTDFLDRKMWVEELTNTYVGDSNFDGEFSSADFVAVFTTAKYETGDAATWAEGDWNGDGVFSSSDFVAAFSGGGYEQGARDGGLNVVPEPTSIALILLGMMSLFGAARRK